MIPLRKVFGRGVREDEAATLLEYALLLVFIALVAIAAVTSVGTKVKAAYSSAESQIP